MGEAAARGEAKKAAAAAGDVMGTVVIGMAVAIGVAVEAAAAVPVAMPLKGTPLRGDGRARRTRPLAARPVADSSCCRLRARTLGNSNRGTACCGHGLRVAAAGL